MTEENRLLILRCPSCGAQTPIEVAKPPKSFTCVACGKEHQAKECVACDFAEKCQLHSERSNTK